MALTKRTIRNQMKKEHVDNKGGASMRELLINDNNWSKSLKLHKEVADYDYDYQTHSKLVNIILEETLKNIKLDSTSDMNLPWEIELKEI